MTKEWLYKSKYNALISHRADYRLDLSLLYTQVFLVDFV